MKKDKKSVHISKDFLPTSKEEMNLRGWDELDILLISGDAYIDHPSFGVSLLGRVLEDKGYRVGIVSQPKWQNCSDIEKMGRPRLFAGISAGSLDSMLSHYTAFRKKRSDDAYTPGGKAGSRPNRAVVVYANLVKQAFPKLPVAVGGIEASLRRAAHYDFWTDALRQSILFDSKADILLYGMAERAVVELAEKTAAGESIHGIQGTAFIAKKDEDISGVGEIKEISSFEEIKQEKFNLVKATLEIEKQVHAADRILIQKHNNRRLVIMPPAAPLAEDEIDKIYSFPFTRDPHPSYKEKIPALEMIRFSITSHRGCGGGCTFCSLSLHQGRHITSRSQKSIINEAESFVRHKDFKGSVSDIGGPTANSYRSVCRSGKGKCSRKSCYSPKACPELKIDHKNYQKLLSAVDRLEGIKHIRIASGIRYDLALGDREFIEKVCSSFTGGQLKLAPEHSVKTVLDKMRKTDFSLFEQFLRTFTDINAKQGKRQYIVPYLMSAFPGCSRDDMKKLSGWFKKQGWQPQQIQCFIPSPGTLATAMYYAECDSAGSSIYVAKTDRERLEQHSIISPAKKKSR
ncbi:MAG: YgiQ family radical SAM protein [Planctomycetota bacterium]|jgi:uncharacterized radical SAM protein YgiQ